MLKIDRNEPSKKFFELVSHSKDDLFEWARRPAAEREQRRAPFNSDIFHQKELRSLVAFEFEEKCAYCERPLEMAGEIDHFRPKSLYPWLAFEWLNFMYACGSCNQSKSNSFPLSGRPSPFLATLDEIRLVEKPLLIDPTWEHPGKYLSFLTTGLIIPRNNSRKGRETISAFQLNENELVVEREIACTKSLETWAYALEKRTDLPSDFLTKGPFLGCQQWSIAQSIANYKKLPTAKVTGPDLEGELKQILAISSEEDRSRILQNIEALKADDTKKSEEFKNAIESGSVRVREQYYVGAAPSPVRDVDGLIAPFFARSNISSIRISNFKGIEELSLELPSQRKERAGAPCLLLLGENAVGKSSFLLGIGLALLGSEEIESLGLSYSSLARSVGRETWDQWGQNEIRVAIEFHGKSEPAVFSYDPTSGSLGGSQHQSQIVLGYGPHRYFSPTKKRRYRSSAERIRSLFDPARPLPDPTDWLEKISGSEFGAVAATIRTILPIGDSDDLVNNPEFGICVRADGQLTPVSKLSEGYRSVFAMIADICRALLEDSPNLEDARGVVLIDEIDTHLHPRWKMQVMSSLRRAFPKVQFIVTSHDPLCLRGMEDGEVIVLYRDSNGRVKQMEDLPDVSGMQAEQLLTSEYFGLASTLDADVHLEIARISGPGGTESSGLLGAETDELISRLTIGDSATAQIIQEALQNYLVEREKPVGGLSRNARAEAVIAVSQALRSKSGET